jgi:formiminoglutamase
MFRPPEVDIPRSRPSDPRVGQLLGRKLAHPQQARVVVVGFPCDQGVRLNRGRVGAAGAPDVVRRALYGLTPDPDSGPSFHQLLEHTADLGNLVPCGDLEKDQERLAETVASSLDNGALPIVIGGGHETAYGHFLAYVRGQRKINILNWDAHADVRPLVEGHGHSGSPFRQALEHASRACGKYTVAGLLRHAVSRTHLAFIEEQGGEYLWRDSLSSSRVSEIYRAAGEPLMVTFDLDAVDQAYAPGVSAPAAAGLEPALWLHASYEAGRHAKVTSIDLVEMNPTYDRDGQTARLAALTLWWFFKGLAERDSR